MRPCFYLTLLFAFLLTACRPEFRPLKKNYDDLPAFTEKGIHVVVEIPAGTNHLVAFNPQTHRFENQRDNNQPRVVNFLPFPGNYGFVPGTRLTAPKGGETRPPRVLVIGESVPTGTLLEARPLGALILKEAGAREIQIVAVPADSSQNVLQVFDFQEFAIEQ
ncbi:MAG: inorganic diphosphatase, partial [Bacteroidetes bacterium]